MKWALVAFALLPASAMAEVRILRAIDSIEFKIARTIDDRCRSLVLTPEAIAQAQAEADAYEARFGAEMRRLLAKKDVVSIERLQKEIRATRANDGEVIKAFETKYSVQLGREPSSLCKAGEAEIKSGTAIGRMLKRK